MSLGSSKDNRVDTVDMADSPAEYFLRVALGEGDRDAEADVVCRCRSNSKYEPRLEPAIEPGREDESGGCNV